MSSGFEFFHIALLIEIDNKMPLKFAALRRHLHGFCCCVHFRMCTPRLGYHNCCRSCFPTSQAIIPDLTNVKGCFAENSGRQNSN